jgi:hypothetical protein
MTAPRTIEALGRPTVLLAGHCRVGWKITLEAQLQLASNSLIYVVTGPSPDDMRLFTELQPALDYYSAHDAAMERATP